MGKTILIALIVIVVAAATGYGGYRMGDSAGFERANQVRQQFFQQRQATGGQGQPGGSGGGGQGRGAGISGVIKSVDGDTMTVTLGNRDVKVELTDKTQILKSTSSTRSELAAGTRVMITAESGGGGGSRNNNSSGGSSDGFNAAAIQILPPQ